MAFDDLRAYLTAIEERGDLVRVTREVQSGPEIYSIVWELNDRQGPAVVFESVKGHSMPIATNLFGSVDRFALSCGFPPGRSPREYRDLFLRAMDRSTWRPPRLVSTGPCKEVVLRDTEVDLTRLPILQWHPLDGGPYITVASVITKDARLGTNIGVYRMMVHDRSSTGIMCNVFQHIGAHMQRAKRAGKDSLECAVALGVDPSISIAACSKMELDADEYAFASALRGGEPVEVVKAETVDLEVPATAEIVLEGEISLKERRAEGPYSEWMGYFEEKMMLPVFKVRCITHRQNPIFHAVMTGHQWGDEEQMRTISHIATLTQHCKEHVIGFADAWSPEYSHGYTAIVSIKKRFPGWGKQAIYQMLGMAYTAAMVNNVIVVDDDIDPSNLDQVMWALSTRVDPALDVILTPQMGAYPLNPAAGARPFQFGATNATEVSVCSKMGIDATLKLAEERNGRPQSVPVRPVQEVLERVKKEWSSYGLP